MTERDLENMKAWPVPPSGATAKRAALDAALAAFDKQANAQVAEYLRAQETTAQGTAANISRTETTRTKRSFHMSSLSRPQMAMAASVAALMIAAPLAFHQLQSRSADTFTSVRQYIESDKVSATARPDAAPTGAKGAAPEMAEPFTTAKVEERAADTAATTRRKDDRKQEIGVTAPANMPAESAQRLEQTKPDVAFDGGSLAVGPPPPPAPAAPAQIAKPAAPASEGGRLTVGNQSLAADNAGMGTDSSDRTLQGGLAQPSASAAPTAHAYRMAVQEKKKLDGLAWMGGDADDRRPPQFDTANRDKFDAKEINPVKQVASEPVSTFSIDVDTASYSFVRRALNMGHLPPKDAVRIEEMINYFPYAYPPPETAETPFKPTVTVFPSPWNASNKLVHVAIKGYDLKTSERPRANLVFLIDVSGSMGGHDRLPLVKNAFRLLLEQLQPDDTVGIVTYAAGSGIALEPTKASDKNKILNAIDALGAGGSTAGAEGIADAYRLAEAGFDKAAVNRIILATDGDFNVGITNQDELKGFIERKRQSGIFLSILGVGQGNHNDALMQALAQNGNGTAAYVDTLNEARKVLVDEASSTLFTIAKDVKVQIEWNPQRVSEYRLIGYETRNLKREDFNNDRVDAGDIGSGHTVTAIYEITPVGAPKLVDDLRYGAKPATPPAADPAANSASHELGFLKLRYKRPKEERSQLVSLPLADSAAAFDSLPAEVRFSTAVAAFGQILKGEPYTQGFSYDDVLKLAQDARGDDPFGYRAEFLNLVRLGKSARP